MNRSLHEDMARFGNLATRSQLRGLGYSDRDIQRAVEQRRLSPIRRRWLAHPGADSRATRAVALGGRLAAASALASHGIWVTRPTGLWIASPPDASHLEPTAPGERRLWVRDRFPEVADRQWRVSPRDAVAQFARIGGESDVVASIDSALNKRLLSASDLDEVFATVPRRLRRLRRRVNGRADSGLETLLRLAAEDQGWRVEVQVRISGVGRVDVLIDGWLVIELDGGQWHDDEQSRDVDRRRDAELVLRGYRWHRFRHDQVLNRMPECLAVIRALRAGGRPAARSGQPAA
ncbi:endonuclease domain-containing protein [Cryobacterium tagatosivorans]|uniref:DUF559 domain-containing protein n=1 Tax=Cryobacterium tagatosivorans TaxID=1259199 RepID=A0A4R8UI67_9MICO|nr:DUF559 domain-containing protein [Cryobacterium tagatosivorans]TFB52476.1 DUF559 domain-containing protein [Cryobacterium tagatosivorans]